MAHYDEMTCLLYLDGQLDALRAGELELHLRSCTPCRALLAALERESGLLQSAITEEDETVPAHLLTAPRPDRVPWGWLLGLSGAGLGAYSVYVMLISPAVTQLENTFGFSGFSAFAMAFFNGAFWKGWRDLMNSIMYLATVTLSLPILWLLRKQMRRLRPVSMVLAGLAGLLAFPSPALATKIEKDKIEYSLPAGETLKENLIVAAARVQIEGTVEGDVFAFGESVVISGRVTGDVIAFAQRLVVRGQVDGDVRAFVETFDLQGRVARNVTTINKAFDLGDKAEIGESLMLFSATPDLSGRIQRDLLAFAGKSRLNGFIGGDAILRGEQVSIRSTAVIGGKTKVWAHKQPQVDSGAKLASPLQFELAKEEGPDYTKGRFYWRQSLKYGAAFFLGLLLLLIMPGFYGETMRQSKNYGPALGVGLLSLVATPIIACIACITIVGIAVGIAGVLVWIFALYAAQIFVGGWLGNRILGDTGDTAGQIGRLALGLLLVRVVISLPYIAGFALFVVLIWGMGAFTLAIFRSLSRGSAEAPLAPTPAMPPAAA